MKVMSILTFKNGKKRVYAIAMLFAYVPFQLLNRFPLTGYYATEGRLKCRSF
jgi:hypothetical protein